MKASDIQIQRCERQEKYYDDFKEFVELEAHSRVHLVLPGGTELIFATTEWAWIYIKEVSSNESI